MHMIFPLVAAFAVTAAAQTPEHPLPNPEQREDSRTGGACADRIEQIRDNRGLPRLQRNTALTDEPLLIAALDKRIDGCGVLVMRHDISDIRPVPQASKTAGLMKIQ